MLPIKGAQHNTQSLLQSTRELSFKSSSTSSTNNTLLPHTFSSHLSEFLWQCLFAGFSYLTNTLYFVAHLFGVCVYISCHASILSLECYEINVLKIKRNRSYNHTNLAPWMIPIINHVMATKINICLPDMRSRTMFTITF